MVTIDIGEAVGIVGPRNTAWISITRMFFQRQSPWRAFSANGSTPLLMQRQFVYLAGVVGR